MDQEEIINKFFDNDFHEAMKLIKEAQTRGEISEIAAIEVQYLMYHVNQGRDCVQRNTIEAIHAAREHLRKASSVNEEHDLVQLLKKDIERCAEFLADECYKEGERLEKTHKYADAAKAFQQALDVVPDYQKAQEAYVRADKEAKRVQDDYNAAAQEFFDGKYKEALQRVTEGPAQFDPNAAQLRQSIENLELYAKNRINEAMALEDPRESLEFLAPEQERLVKILDDEQLPFLALESRAAAWDAYDESISTAYGNLPEAITILIKTLQSPESLEDTDIQMLETKLNEFREEHLAHVMEKIKHLDEACKFDECESTLQKARDFFGKNTDWWNRLLTLQARVKKRSEDVKERVARIQTAKEGRYWDAAFEEIQSLQKDYPSYERAKQLKDEVEAEMAYQQGKEHLQARRYGQAKELFVRADEKGHPDAGRRFQEAAKQRQSLKNLHDAADSALNRKDFDTVERMLNELVKGGPDGKELAAPISNQLRSVKTQADSLWKRAQELAKEEKWREALAQLNEHVLKVYPDYTDAKRVQADWQNIVDALEDYEQAEKAIEKGALRTGVTKLRQAVKSIESLKNKPAFYAEANEKLQSLEAELLQEFLSEYKEAFDAKQYAKAAGIVKDGLSLFPDDAKFKEAKQGLEARQREIDELTSKALKQLKKGDLEDAQATWDSLFELAPENADVVALGKEIQDAIKKREKQAQADELCEEGLKLLEGHKYDEAIERFDSALALIPEHIRAKQGKEDAQQKWDEFVEKYTQAKTAYDEKRYAEAKEQLSDILDISPDARKLYREIEELEKQVAALLEQAREQMEDNPNVAQQTIEDALEVWPNEPRALGLQKELQPRIRAAELVAVAENARTDGDLPGAIKYLKEALEKYDDANARALLEEIQSEHCQKILTDVKSEFHENKRLDEAKQLAQEGMELYSKEDAFARLFKEIDEKLKDVKIKYEEAKASFEVGRIAECKALLSEISEIYPEYEPSLKLAKDVADWEKADEQLDEAEKHKSIGQFSQAISIVQDVLESIPNHLRGRKLLEELERGGELSGVVRVQVSGSTIGYQLIPKTEVTIGSSAGNDIVLSGGVAGHHAKFVAEAKGWMLHPLSESRATIVNGQTITEPVALAVNDEICFGQSDRKLRCRILRQSSPDAPASAALDCLPRTGFGLPNIVYVLLGNDALIGASGAKQAEIDLMDDNINPQHARLIYEKDAYWLEPLAETKHDDEVCAEKVRLHPGSKIEFGETELRVQPLRG